MEKSRERFDVIVGDLADPVEGGPCYQLYTKSFYEHIVKPKLNDHGIFVTQVPYSIPQNHFGFQIQVSTVDHLLEPIGWTCRCSHSQRGLLIYLQYP